MPASRSTDSNRFSAARSPGWRWPYAPAVRTRNRVSYLTVRRFSAQDRVGAIRAIKRLKA